MINIQTLIDNPEEIVAKLKSKGFENAETTISTILLLREETKAVQQLVDTVRQLKNYISETNARLKKDAPELMILWKDEL